jgi:hypothetical protein
VGSEDIGIKKNPNRDWPSSMICNDWALEKRKSWMVAQHRANASQYLLGIELKAQPQSNM